MKKLGNLNESHIINEFLERNGLTLTGLRRATKTRLENGYPIESHIVTFKEGPDCRVMAPASFFTDGEKDRIEAELANIELPVIIPYTAKTLSPDAPKELRGVSLDPRSWKNIDWSKDDVVCPIFDDQDNLVMIEQRYRNEAGEKCCVRWSYHDDFTWKTQDPDKFPLWGLDQIAGNKTVFLHEGPKAAAAGRRFYQFETLGPEEKKAIKEHPWFDELSKYPHLGWIGGSNRSDRTNWGILRKLGVERVILVPDNDAGGRQSAYDISGYLRKCDVRIFPRYPDHFPIGWDIADGFSEIDKVEAKRIEERKPVESYVNIPKNAIDITPYWSWVPAPTNADPFKRKPEPIPNYPNHVNYIRSIDVFIDTRNGTMIPWAKVGHYFGANLHPTLIDNYGKHLATMNDASYDDLTFEPMRTETFSDKGKVLYNLWRPLVVQPKPMSEEGRRVWMEYLCRLAPDPIERALLMRWLATVILCPNRKHFGVIIHSTQQGTGKTTLFEAVLRPIIGEEFTAQATNDDLSSKFTEWREAKVLVYADEVKGTKQMPTVDVYNRMKGWVTSDRTRIEKKGLSVYWVPDYSKILINSNKDVPIFIEDSDRRFLVIHGGETKMSRGEGERLRGWLRNGGLSEVVGWAMQIENEADAAIDPLSVVGNVEFIRTFDLPYEAGFIPANSDAPLTKSKGALLAASKPDWIRHAGNLLGQLETPIAVFEEDDPRNSMSPEERLKIEDDGTCSFRSLPLAMPDLVLTTGLNHFCLENGVKAFYQAIISHLKDIDMFITDGTKDPKPGDMQCNMHQGKISGKIHKRHNIMVNRPCLDMLIKAGAVMEHEVDWNRNFFVPRENAAGKRPVGYLIRMMKNTLLRHELGIPESHLVYRPNWIWVKGPTAGFTFADMNGPPQR